MLKLMLTSPCADEVISGVIGVTVAGPEINSGPSSPATPNLPAGILPPCAKNPANRLPPPVKNASAVLNPSSMPSAAFRLSCSFLIPFNFSLNTSNTNISKPICMIPDINCLRIALPTSLIDSANDLAPIMASANASPTPLLKFSNDLIIKSTPSCTGSNFSSASLNVSSNFFLKLSMVIVAALVVFSPSPIAPSSFSTSCLV